MLIQSTSSPACLRARFRRVENCRAVRTISGASQVDQGCWKDRASPCRKFAGSLKAFHSVKLPPGAATSRTAWRSSDFRIGGPVRSEPPHGICTPVDRHQRIFERLDDRGPSTGLVALVEDRSRVDMISLQLARRPQACNYMGPIWRKARDLAGNSARVRPRPVQSEGAKPARWFTNAVTSRSDGASQRSGPANAPSVRTWSSFG